MGGAAPEGPGKAQVMDFAQLLQAIAAAVVTLWTWNVDTDYGRRSL
jgi:hypothetical protein